MLRNFLIPPLNEESFNWLMSSEVSCYNYSDSGSCFALWPIFVYSFIFTDVEILKQCQL